MKIRLLLVFALLATTAASRVHAQSQVPLVMPAAPAGGAKGRPPLRQKAPPRRLQEAAGVHNQAALPRPAAHLTPQAQAPADQGNVSVLQDDGTLIIPTNGFDLVSSSLTFTPQGNGYTVQSVTPTFVNPGSGAQAVRLAGQSSQQYTLPFTFKFYGTSYTHIFLNPFGNLTFVNQDINDFYFDLRSLETGPPRIAPMFDYLVDEYGGGDGQVGVESFSDHINFYWIQVEDFPAGELNTFEAILYNTGVIQFNYSTGMDPNYTSAVVGLSPGGASSIQTIDFSQQSSPLAFNGVIDEVFSPYSDLDLLAIGQNFYQSHPDNYDAFIAFADFDGLGFNNCATVATAPCYPYSQQITNGTQGIGLNTFQFNSFFGSKSRLFISGNGGSIDQYPADPTQTFLGPHSTLTLMGQVFGHAWMAYVDTNPPSLMGLTDLWSFTMDGQGSVMEGNLLQNNGNGTFTTVNADYKYSPLDEYLMGLRQLSNVPSWYVVNNPALISAPSDFDCPDFGPQCYAEIGVQFSGTASPVTIQNVVTNVGSRSPTVTSSQKSFNVAFILVEPQGQTANPQSVAQLDSIRSQFQPWFATATDGLGTMSTSLAAFAPTITSVSPNQGPAFGNTSVTINGTNFQATSTVTIGGNTATVTSATSTSLLAVIPANSSGGNVPLVVTNPDGQKASSSYTYSTAPVSQLQVSLAASGSLHAESSGTAASTQVGYGVINPATGVAVLRSFAGGQLVSEAAVPPTPAATQWTMYAEYDGPGTGISTGIAIANPGSAAATLTLTLNNGNQTTLQLAAGAQHAAFVNEFFPNLTTFLGTMTVQSNTPVSIVALRGTTNKNGQFIISTIPLSAGVTTATGGFATFPTVADGGGYATDIILVNSGTVTSTGTIAFSGFTGGIATDLGTNSSFAFTIPAGGMWRVRTAGTPAAVTSGYAAMSVTASSPTPSATAIIRLNSGGNLTSETSIPAQVSITNAMMFGSYETNLSTGIALLNGGGQPVQVTLQPLDGTGAAVGSAGTVTVQPYANLVEFLNQIIPSLQLGFEGTVLVQSSAPIWAISLRGSNTINGFLMSTTPVLDLTQNYSGAYYFPQVVDGGGYTTEFLMMNAGSANIQLQFFSNSGQPMSLSLNN